MRDLTGIVARVHTGEEVRDFDRRAIHQLSIPGIRLMLRAGRACLTALRERWRDAKAVTVVCGSGNNAGDGYVIAGLGADAGLDVQLIETGDPGKLTGDALTARRFAMERLGDGAVGAWPARGDVVVDALLGTGARGAVRAPCQAAIDRINASGKAVLAVDMPTGVDADTGGLLASAPVRAAVTVTFLGVKLGLVTGPGVDYVGELIFNDLGVPPEIRPDGGVPVLDGRIAVTRLRRRRNAHKGDFGRLLVVGGAEDMGGAALLAGEAALRAGAGLVKVATRVDNRAAILARRPELMVRGLAAAASEAASQLTDALTWATAVAVGPGLGRDDWGAALLRRCLDAGKPLVVDADGLNVLAASQDAPRAAADDLVLTPHPGEAARLLGVDAAWVANNRPEATARLGAQGAVAVLKGAGTLIAADGALRGVCLGGNPGMATPGSGDVLTGVVGALLARGQGALDAARLGVWLHARAGDEALAATRSTLLAADIVDALRLTS